MFSYDPKDAETAWPEAQYPAVFKTAVDSVSKGGNPMQVWTFEVYDDATNRKQTVTDYATAAALFKVRMLASALGFSAQFKEGNFRPEDHINSPVIVSLKIESSAGYDDKNRIDRISARPPENATGVAAKRDTSPVPAPAGGTAPMADEDIPF